VTGGLVDAFFPLIQSGERAKQPLVRWQDNVTWAEPPADELAGGRLRPGVMAIDFDVKPEKGENGYDSLRLYAPGDEPDDLPNMRPETFSLPSQSGRGEHAYYRVDPDRYVANKRGVLPGIDFRVGGKGYVAVLPEFRRSVANLDPASLAPAPEWVYELSERTSSARKAGGKGWREMVWQSADLDARLDAIARSSGKGETLNNQAYHYARETGDGWDEVGEQFVSAGMAAGSDDERETRRIVRRALESGQAAEVFRCGWPRQLEAVPDDADPGAPGYLVSAADWLAMPEPEPLIVDVLPVGQTLFFGDSSSGKSFLLADVSLRLALGLDWHGYEVPSARKVVYVAAEGEVELRLRVEAWLDHHGYSAADLADRWTVVPQGLMLDQAALFVEECQAWGAELVVYDTWGKVTGDDENDNGLANKYLGTIRRAAPSSLLVHHMGHKEKGRPRGASALHNGLDSSYLVMGEHAEGEDDETSGKLVGVTLVSKKRRGRRQASTVHLLVKDHGESAVLLGGDSTGTNGTECRVLQWREDNPAGTQGQCAEELGIGERSARRYWRAA
jgi:hypothetical protein